MTEVVNREETPKTFARVGVRLHTYLDGYNGPGRPAVAMCDAVIVIPREEIQKDGIPYCLDCQYAMISYEDHLVTEAHTRAVKLEQELFAAGHPRYKVDL